MQRREVRMTDGRYLVFYTFDDEQTPKPATPPSESEKPEHEEPRDV